MLKFDRTTILSGSWPFSIYFAAYNENMTVEFRIETSFY